MVDYLSLDSAVGLLVSNNYLDTEVVPASVDVVDGDVALLVDVGRFRVVEPGQKVEGGRLAGFLFSKPDVGSSPYRGLRVQRNSGVQGGRS